jgi:hypothetical protein
MLNAPALRALLPYTVRTLARVSLLAVVALSATPVVLTVARGGNDLSTPSVAAAIIGAVALAHAVDDPHDGVLVASPTPRWARRAIRLAVAGSVIAVGWLAAVVVAAAGDGAAPALGQRGLEALAAGGVSVAVASAARQRWSIDPAALVGAAAGLVGVLFVSVMAYRLRWLPELGGGPHHGRWWVIAAAAWAAAAWEARDPALRRRPGSR